jgi:hypothetical protein
MENASGAAIGQWALHRFKYSILLLNRRHTEAFIPAISRYHSLP